MSRVWNANSRDSRLSKSITGGQETKEIKRILFFDFQDQKTS